ncbi:oligoendopeptidase F [Bacillus sp. MUM 13]|uniref:oligoendopeptidase F n=1 Tax=Bacillus sp. MUM 13 TaxID=1678001 RepID=UPI0008F5707B|nr:oligoendopeptidase F [Bacillus sp. MUM 13]OIK13455.1 oligoendopeptidase F [Bacillus sp. MUM 13]
MEKTMEKRLFRSEVPVEQTWNLEDLFSSREDWKAQLENINQEIPALCEYQGQLSNRDKLVQCLELREQLHMKLTRAGTYASLRRSADGTDSVNQADYAQFSALMTKVNAALSFIDSEILELPESDLREYVASEPNLKVFEKNLLELLETKKHKLSPETEKALAALGDVHSSPYKVYEMGKLADMQFQPIHDEEGNEYPVSFSLFEDRYEFSPDTALRRKAYGSFVNTLKQYKNTFAQAYSAEVSKQVALSRLRSYESVTEMLLEPQQVTAGMYNNQLDIIQGELAPHMRRYAQLKKKVMGLDKMLFCDLKAPLDPEFNPATTYEDACEVILEALKVMGPEYSEIMKKGLTERWVDRTDNVGKGTGAFCSSPYGVHPYILITWQDTMRGAFVLAHELGHAGHFYLANKNQRLFNTRPSTYFVEAPSTLNELLLAKHLLANTEDKQMRRWIILQLLGTYYHNFVTHLLEGEYQRRVYMHAENGHPLTAKTLSEIKGNVLAGFWGDAVEIDEDASLTWMRQPHYYMGLYPYTYSAGLTASTAAAQMIQEEGQPAVDRWLEVLRAGGTKKPLELLKHAGVDMSKPECIKQAVSYVGSLVDELIALYE